VTLYFLDSSALVKRYVPEIGTTWIQALTDADANNQLYIARITWVEVISALARRQREGSLNTTQITQIFLAFRHHLNTQYRVLELTQTLTELAGQLVSQHPIRAYDAVQLASAISLRNTIIQAQLPDLVFLTADDRLITIAQTIGLLNDNPNNFL
jgi:predicted nucleic acid-binding protein